MDTSTISPALLIASLIIASTPIMLAAIGELVVERAGVLNLGVEGMMITGAICGFAVSVENGSPTLGILASILGGAALSLIFAVFLTNPSPICVLDEVDAPLDDANVTRFCSLLEELTNITNTKFIIVTHHALTMSKMDRLYGVTMPEKGISQLVAVDLQKAESMVA